MNRLTDWLVERYTNDSDRSVAVLLGNLALLSAIALLGIAVITYFNADPESSIALGITAAGLLVVLLVLRLGGLALARWLMPLIAFLIVSFEVYAIGDGTKEVQILGYPIVILFGTLLLGTPGAWVFTILSSLSYTLILFIHKFQLFRPYELADQLLPLDALVAAVILGLTAWIQVTIVNRLTQSAAKLEENETALKTTIQALEDAQATLEKQVEERTAQIAVSAEVGRVASSFLNQEEIVARVVQLISERFGYYYAALFLIDENGVWANLVNATGEAGAALLDRGHRLQVGGRSMVGSAIATRSPRIALDAGAEPVRFNNPLLPRTRSEIALPLVVGSRVLGALDVQSTEGNAFGSEDIEVLQNMANQVAVALDNARLYQETQARLEELNRLYRRELRPEPRALVYRQGELVAGAPTQEAFETAFEEPALQVQHEGNRTEVTVPFVSGGQVLGIMQLRSSRRRWTDEEIQLIETAASQVSIALENALLVQESQERARRERALSEGTSQLRETFDIEAILQTAAAEIQRTLNLTEVEVEIGMEPNPSGQNGQ